MTNAPNDADPARAPDSPGDGARPADPGPDASGRAGLWTLVGGLALLAGAFALASMDTPPGRIFFYHLAWGGTLAAMAGGLARRTGRWPLGAPAAVSLFFWSAPVWYLYELVNFRIENWYYVLIAPEAPVRWVGTFLAFGTVLPALYLAYRWARELGFAEGWSRPRFEVGPVHLAAALALGVAFAALAMWRPRAFYPLVWGAVTLLVEPWNHRRDPATSLLGDLSRGSWARIARLLAGGLFIGLLWELYNSMAAARWIYTVPGLERVKLFEMPFPGFLGFPVLALDGYVVYRALEGLGVAVPAWGEGDAGRAPAAGEGRAGGETPADPHGTRAPGPGAGRGGEDRTTFRPGRAAAAALAALTFCAAVQTGVDRWTLDSVYPDLEEVPGVAAGTADGLRAAGIGDVEALAAADSADLVRGGGLAPAAAGAAVRGARLTVLRGMGAANAAALWDAGVRSVCELAEAGEGRVSTAVRAARDAPNAGDPARVRVWLRAARDRCDAGPG